jgi:hypothetical protein
MPMHTELPRELALPPDLAVVVPVVAVVMILLSAGSLVFGGTLYRYTVALAVLYGGGMLLFQLFQLVKHLWGPWICLC